ncbi:two component transcriptional regulator, LytTR family [Thiorhodococcus drewsii AZ1]|uniref:Two component transcriptional regulator, LytTR family n=1 Tax=Thiorhodococcus drewsii AZ1 TaxID=765913 RepID=G2E1T4_9GAMM|nr:LytTR family DNA-binding domain-containing protein [Thiorhodococcus drewsii]EGV31142.1 two component transcriptional regulator, LytTR family [Thiorhodococcus drewsii AZ1]
MKILVVDDDSPTRERIRQLLAKTDGRHEFAGEASDGWEAIARCRAQPVDLVFLDTQMPGLNGFEAAHHLAKLDKPPTVVLMTSEQPLPLQTSGQEIAACLFKPVRPERLEEILLVASQCGSEHPTQGSSSNRNPNYPTRRGRITAQYRGRMRSVDLSDIIYLHADQKYVTVRHLGGELLVDESLRSLEQEFPDLFVRIHRNALVARSRFHGLEKDSDGTTSVRLRDCPDRLSVSRRHLAEVRRWLNQRDRQAG